MSFLNLQQRVLGVESRVLCKCPGDTEQGIREALDTKLDLSADLRLHMVDEMSMSGDFESAGTRNDSLIIDGVLNGTESVTNRVFHLGNRVVIRSLDKDRAREWVFDTLNERVFVFAEVNFVDMFTETKILLSHIVDRVEGHSTAGKRDALHVSLFGPPDSNDVLFGQQVKAWRVNALLINNDKALISAVTELLLELDDLHYPIVRELPLGSNELLPLIGVAPEETGMDLCLFIFE